MAGRIVILVLRTPPIAPIGDRSGSPDRGLVSDGVGEVVGVEDEAEVAGRGGYIMPFGDGTGPMGMGPMTGRGAGYCAGYGAPGYLNPAFGRGWWRGGGWGRGWWGAGRGFGGGWWRSGYAPASGAPAYGYAPYGGPLSKEQEADALRQQADLLTRSLETINQRLEELEKED